MVAPRGPRNKALLEALDRLQGEGALLALGPSGPDTTGLTMLRAALAGEAELVKAGWRVRAGPKDMAAAARAMGRLAQAENAGTEAAVLNALAGYCGRVLAAYPTTLQQDEEEMGRVIMEQQQGREEGQELRLQVLRALVCEKRALAGTAAAVVEWQRRLQGGCHPSELYGELMDDDEVEDDNLQ